MAYKIGDQVVLVNSPYHTINELGTITSMTGNLYNIVSKTSPKDGYPYFEYEFKSANSHKIRERLGVR